jgi:PAS domain S-box-containing protein
MGKMMLERPDTALARALKTISLDDEARQFALLLQGVTDYAIYMLDPQGVIRSWNSGGYRIKGYTAEEVIGQHFSRFYTQEDIENGVPARSLGLAASKGKFEAEGWRVRKDGTRFRANVVIDPIWQDGEIIGFAKVTRDVTERYEAQIQLEEAQRALVQSQKLEAIGKLTLGLAHDFNNLLTVIVNSLDIIRLRCNADPTTQNLVDAALRASDRGALLTRQLLAFGSGQTLVANRHSVNELLSRSMELYRRACGASIDFEIDLAETLPDILVDATQFEAAILNLVSNSRDAMPNGGRIVLSSRLARRAPPSQAAVGNFVCVEVTDNGSGMPDDVQDRAFEPFFTTKEVGKGSGLGLSQVFGFATQSGGFATLSSHPGVGTAVSIYLPAVEEPAHE